MKGAMTGKRHGLEEIVTKLIETEEEPTRGSRLKMSRNRLANRLRIADTVKRLVVGQALDIHIFILGVPREF